MLLTPWPSTISNADVECNFFLVDSCEAVFRSDLDVSLSQRNGHFGQNWIVGDDRSVL